MNVLAAQQQGDLISILAPYLPVLLTLFLINVWVLWRRFRSRRQLLQRVAELEELSQAGSAIVAAQLDFDALCDLVVAETDKIIDTRTFQLGFFDGDLYHIQAWMVDGEPRPPQSFNLSENSGLIGWVRTAKQPLLVRNLEKEKASLPAPPRYVDRSPKSFVFIPLVSGDVAIGVLGAYSDEANHFSHKQMRQLSILANQAAAALESARLFKAERRRAAQVELIGRITHQINATEGIEELFAQVTSLTQTTFGFYQVNIYAVDKKRGVLELKASSSTELPLEAVTFGWDEGIVGAAVVQQQTIISNNLAEDERCLHSVGIPEVDELWARAQSALSTPLVVNETVWGVLEVSSDTVGAFGAQEQSVLEALAAGVAIAIQKTQQIHAQREQAWLTNARLQVAETLGSSEELEPMLEGVTRLVPLLTGIKRVGCLLWQPEEECYAGTAAAGLSPAMYHKFMGGRWPLGAWGALDAVHVGKEPLTTDRPPPWSEPGHTQPLTLWPLTMKSRNLGVLFIESQAEGNNPGRHYEFLQDMAQQLSQAVDRVQLRQAQEEEAWVNTALLQVASAVNSLIDLNEILNTIVRLVPLLLGVKNCLILIWDDEHNHYRPGPSYGISEMGHGLLGTLEMSRRELQEMALKDSTAESSGVAHYVLRLPRWLQRVLGVPYASAVPLVAQGRLVGALIAGQSEAAPRMKGRRLNILYGIAQQAGTAVLNNTLYEESAERSRLEKELDVARRIQASLIPRTNPDIPRCSVASYWAAARQVSGDFFDFVQLASGDWAIIIADVADKGVPAALFMAVSRTILRAVANSRSDPAAILQRANQLILNDSDSDLFVTVFIATWHAKTRTLRYACGGHNPPLLYHLDGQISQLHTRGMALGVLPEAQFENRKVTLEQGETVVFYTDGITEAINEDYAEFGIERLNVAVRAVNGWEPTQGNAASIVTAITEAVRDHAGMMPQFDDITMVVLQCCE